MFLPMPLFLTHTGFGSFGLDLGPFGFALESSLSLSLLVPSFAPLLLLLFMEFARVSSTTLLNNR